MTDLEVMPPDDVHQVLQEMRQKRDQDAALHTVMRTVIQMQEAVAWTLTVDRVVNRKAAPSESRDKAIDDLAHLARTFLEYVEIRRKMRFETE